MQQLKEKEKRQYFEPISFKTINGIIGIRS
jgi:hypothetical protein